MRPDWDDDFSPISKRLSVIAWLSQCLITLPECATSRWVKTAIEETNDEIKELERQLDEEGTNIRLPEKRIKREEKT